MKVLALIGMAGIVITVFVYPLILSAANRYINGFWAHYGRAIGTVVLTTIIVAIVVFMLGKVIGTDHFWAILVVNLVLQTLIGGALMHAFIKRSDGSPLGFARAARAYLVLAIISALVSIAVRPYVASLQANAHKLEQQRDAAPSAASSVPPPAASPAAAVASAATSVPPPSAPASATTVPAAGASSP